MAGRRVVTAAIAAAAVLAVVLGAVVIHALSGHALSVARGAERSPTTHLAQQSHTAHTATRLAQQSHTASGRPTASPLPTTQGHGAARQPSLSITHPARSVHPRPAPLLAPRLPGSLSQLGGREPAGRVLAAASWLNTRELTITVRMSSAMTATSLQPQVELRAAGQRFTGQITDSGAVVAYHGQPVLGVVRLRGLRDDTVYRWRVRVHDVHGPSSPWVSLPGTALRVYLGRPAAPVLALATPAQPDGWVATRLLTLRWSAPRDCSGVRGFSYTLSRSPLAVPPLHLRTWHDGVTVRAASDGLWYMTVRSLDQAHTWGPPARLTIRIDTRQPRLDHLTVPTATINPARMQPLVSMTLADTSWVTMHVTTPAGQVLSTITSSLHRQGDHVALIWDGRDAAGRLAPNGSYLLAISARNRAGASWQITRPLSVETTPPALMASGLAHTGTYNPYNNGLDGPEVITATLKGAVRARIEALHGGAARLVWSFGPRRLAHTITAVWNGKAADGTMLPGGLYTFRLETVDAAGNTARYDLGWVVVDHRRIVVSLNQQQLWAMDGNRVLLTSYVTTGGPELPTPLGNFQILDRESPFTFHSLWPKTSPFWYPDSKTNFALLFDYDGYFIHDAPWRGAFGPGTNSVDGIPGQNYTGTHGCVNVPYYPMAWLFNWATMSTPVQVRQSYTPGAA